MASAPMVLLRSGQALSREAAGVTPGHSRATEVRKRFGLETAQVTLGHTRANATEFYAERGQGLAVEVARKIS
jgi:hypothetical protein